MEYSASYIYWVYYFLIWSSSHGKALEFIESIRILALRFERAVAVLY